MKNEKIWIVLILLILISGCKLSEKELCENAGGKWNECGSPCAGTDSEFCIQSCKAQCECNDKYRCPENYNCKITENEEFGVCTKE